MKRRIKKVLVFCMAFLCISQVKAITSNEVTYDNDGTTESLTTTLDTLYSELKKYKTGGSVQANQMLEGATGYSKGELVTGTIKSKGATTYTPGTNNQTIAAGQYLSGAQTIKGDANLVAGNIKSGVSIFGVSGTYTSDANATAANILSGKTAYVNGSKVTGNIKNNSGITLETNIVRQDATYTYLTIPETGYYDTGSVMKVANSTLNGDLIFKSYNIGLANGFTSDSTAECWANKYLAQIILRVKIPNGISSGWINIGTIQNLPYRIHAAIVRMAVSDLALESNNIVYRDVNIYDQSIYAYLESIDAGKYLIIDVTRVFEQ